jgi:LAO/AO transport system kinase
MRPEPRRAAFRLLDSLEADAGNAAAVRIGLTGAPGTGKSTLLDALVRQVRSQGRTAGIIAVDPSSSRTGGALLGDRIRVRSRAGDPGVFFRSMAARNRLGGLADAARAGVIVLSSAFDVVFVETVGVGQSEGDVAGLVDTLVYLAQPGAGDMLQFMKAGILELPDLFVVNKADLGPSATRTASELEAGLALGERTGGGWVPPVVLVSARDGKGIDALVDALDAHRTASVGSGQLVERRRRGRDAFVRDAILKRYGSYGLEAIGGPEALAERLRGREEASGFALADAVSREIEDRLGRQRR